MDFKIFFSVFSGCDVTLLRSFHYQRSVSSIAQQVIRSETTCSLSLNEKNPWKCFYLNVDAFMLATNFRKSFLSEKQTQKDAKDVRILSDHVYVNCHMLQFH